MKTHALLRRSALILGGGVLAAALAFGVGSAATASPPTNSGTQGLNYVALGDSYAAGFGLTPPTGTPVPGCFQAAVDYPHQVATALGLNLTDASCSAAATANITGQQVTVSGTAPAQIDSITSSTNVVTIMIGGNDLGFSTILGACSAATPSGPLLLHPALNSCKAYFDAGGVDTLQAAISGPVTTALSNTFHAVRAKAPNATIIVVGYPALFPDAANTPTTPTGCFTPVVDLSTTPPTPIPNANGFPFTNADVPYLYQTQVSLNTAIQTQAADIGATFVPLMSQTVANTPCAYNPNEQINGLSLTPTGQLAFGAMHPNAVGVTTLTSGVSAAITAAFPDTTPTPTPTPIATSTAQAAPALAESGSDATPAIAVGALALLLGVGSLILVSVRRRATKGH
ncbi:SGNH/GDSL hydrolase family protein [Rathayibacter soli]|uniref:SGNH/GDSL hydrolase family protein n=1 Tax=Rathayibacter soli TaxID=3144168 RepID=UPI0027E48CA0|nr:SGNH/GDSL hydrolase family protein [Glaciibacter superstes]